MRKYSIFKGGELLAKHGIKSLVCIINSRAKRRLRADGSIEMLSYADTNDGEKSYYFSQRTVINAYPSDYEVIHDENSSAIAIPILYVVAFDEFIEVREEKLSILTISDNGFRLAGWSGEKMSTSAWAECLKDSYAKFLEGTVSKELVDLAYRLVSLFNVRCGETYYSRTINTIIQNIDKLSFFKTDKCLEYKELFLAMSARNALEKMLKLGMEGELFEKESDIWRLLHIPQSFQQVAKENPDFLFGPNRWSNYGPNTKLEELGEYPMEIQNILAYYALHNKIENPDVKEFLDWFPKNDMDGVTYKLIQRFIIRDIGKGFSFKNLRELYTHLKRKGLPINSQTLSMKFYSSLINRYACENKHNASENVMDVFEELLEKDALQAIKYLRANQ